MKKILIIFLSLILALTGIIPALADEGLNPYQAPKFVNWSEGRQLTGGDGSPFRMPDRTITVRVMNIKEEKWEYKKWTELQQDRKIYLLKNNEKDLWGYCIEHGVWVNNLSADMNTNNQKVYEKVLHKLLGDKGYDNFNLVLFFGYQNHLGVDVTSDLEKAGFFNSEYHKRSGYGRGTYNRDDWYMATQLLLWEITQGHRGDLMGIYPANNTPVDHYYSVVRGRPAGAIYNWMVDAVKNERVFPQGISGDNKAPNRPKALTMREKNKTEIDGKIYYTYRYTDTTGLGGKYALYKINGEKEIPIKNKEAYIEYDGGKKKLQYTLYLSEELVESNTTLMIKHDNFGYNRESLAVFSWHTKEGTPGNQSMAIGGTDPEKRYINFKDEPEGGEPEPEYFPTIEFIIGKEDFNPGFDGNNKTPMGDAYLNATFALYRDGEEVDRVRLNETGDIKILRDKPWNSPSDFVKTKTGSHPHYIGNPPKLHCTVSPDTLNYDKTVNYEIREIERPAGRYIEPDTGVRKYSVSYHGESKDQRTCIAEPVNWSPFTYNVTRTVIQGDDTVLPIGNSVGTIDLVDDPIFFGKQTFVEDNYRGKITLSKSLQNENVFDSNPLGGVQKDSIKSLWRLKLNSGGLENHPYIRFIRENDLADGTAVYRVVRDNSGQSSETEFMKIGSNGDMVVYDIPFGAYTMEECSADDSSFVLETFQIKIEEHEEGYSPTPANDLRYDYNVRDKKKSNVIKVVKTNGETGKQVFDEGTKFYIRYKGNPLLGDATKSKHYNRFLPNAANISSEGHYTFTTNINGEITIPYELPYGIYEVMEWHLPKGYYVGEYGESGKAQNHNFGEILENQMNALLGHDFQDTVKVYDSRGKRIKFKDKEEYKLNEIYNLYTFKVLNQETHHDGNPSQRVDKKGNITETDPTYDKDDYPYTKYYRIMAMPNNNVKGKIQIKKTGEAFKDFAVKTVKGFKVLVADFSEEINLKGAIFGIYAKEDNKLNDGNEGGKIYDKEGKEIIIPIKKSTHRGNPQEEITGLMGRTYAARVYDTGTLTLPTGEEMFFLKDRNESEINKYYRAFITGASKGTSYKYSYEKEEGDFLITYDIAVFSDFNAGGENDTEVKIVKSIAPKEGSTANIGYSVYEETPEGKRRKKVETPDECEIYYGEPLERISFANHMGSSYEDRSKPYLGDILTVEKEIYLYEADGQKGGFHESADEDFSKLAKKRYLDSDDDTINSEIETIIREKTDKGYERVKKDPAEISTQPCYVVINKTGSDEYLVLLEDKTWTKSDKYGNFENKLVEVFKIKNHQSYDSENGFKLEFEGFAIESKRTGKEAATKITRQSEEIVPLISLGDNYTKEEDKEYTVFKAKTVDANFCLITGDGIKAEMTHTGRKARIVLTIPKDSVNKDFNYIMPKIIATRIKEGVKEDVLLDWYSKLNPTNDSRIFSLFNENIIVKGEKVANIPDTYFSLEILADVDEDNYTTIYFSDGYFAKVYAKELPSGSKVGVMEYEGILNTTRSVKSRLIETIMTDDKGIATSSELPLGKYYVRELSAPMEYVKTEDIKEVEIKHKDQFTPLIWKNLEFKNKYFKVEIDMEKAFETGKDADNYVKGSGALFGIYTASKIQGKEKVYPVDSLVGIASPNENGKILLEIKLPKGKYYLKEIKTREGYFLSQDKIYFNVGDGIAQEEPKIHYDADGITGEITMMKYGKGEIDLRIENRLPMPEIKINEIDYPLDEEVKNPKLRIKVDKAETAVNIKILDEETVSILLPNQKTLQVTVKGNTIDYNLDEVAKTYEQEIALTETYCQYEKKFDREEGGNKEVKKTIFSFRGKGDISPMGDISLTHTPKSDLLDKEGFQVYDSEGTITIEGNTMEFEAGKNKEYTDSLGGVFTYLMTKSGDVVISYRRTFTGNAPKGEEPKVYFPNQMPISEDIIYMENTTNVRTNTKTGCAQIKINKALDKMEVRPIKNRAKDDFPQIPPPPPGNEERLPKVPKIKTQAADIKTGSNKAEAGEKVIIVDRITYWNLTPGKAYVVKGQLMDKETGKELLINKKKISSEKTFIPETADGVVELEFAFNGSDLGGKSIVVFEKLYSNHGVSIASHEDITDMNQTVKFKSKKEKIIVKRKRREKDKEDDDIPKTGEVMGYFDLMKSILALCALMLLIKKERKVK